MWIYRGICLALLAAASCWANEAETDDVRVWTVGEGGKRVRLTFEGRVSCDKDDIAEYVAPGGGLVVEWRARKGDRVKKGDPLHIYSSSIWQSRIPDRELELLEAEKTYALRLLLLEKELRELLDKKSVLQGRLSVAAARLESLRSMDSAKVELLRQQVDRTRQAAKSLRTVFRQQQELFRMGRVPRIHVDRARLAFEQAELAIASADAEWRLASKQIGQSAVHLQQIEIEELRTELGEDRDSGRSGIEARIHGLKRKLAGQRKEFATARERAERFLHEAIRNSWDHTPVGWLELRKDGKPIRRINFQPADQSPPPGLEADSGEPYSDERGYGWERTRSESMCRRGGSNINASVAVVRGEAVWRCRTEPGEIQVVLGIGDDRDWQGLQVRIDGEPVFVANTMKKGQYAEAVHVVTNGREHLEIRFGSPHEKTLMSEIDGTVTTAPWSPDVGDMNRWGRPPMTTYTTRPEKYFVQALIPRECASLLRKGEADESKADVPTGQMNRLEAVRKKLTVADVEIETADAQRFPGRIAEVGEDPVRLSFIPRDFLEREDSKDRVGRRIKIRPEPENAAGLKLDTGVSVAALFDLPASVAWIPGHFIGHDEAGLFATESGTGTRKAVEGFKIGQVFVVASGLKAGDRVMLPSESTGETAKRKQAFDGKVIPGEATPVFVPWQIDGRIRDLRPEGAQVKEGEWIMTLYSPWLEKHKEDMERGRRLVRQKYLQAAEERRLKAVNANIEHTRRTLAEKKARLKLRSLGEVHPLAKVQAENAYRSACLAFNHASNIVDILEGSDIVNAARSEHKRQGKALAKVAMGKQHVAFIHALRAQDWTMRVGAVIDWRNAQEALNIREMVLGLARQEEQVARLQSKQQMEVLLQDRRYKVEQRLETQGKIHARASGRLFYKETFNQLTKQFEKVGKEFDVWDGLVVAEILDMNDLAFEAELPEVLYGRLRPGMKASLVFSHLDGLELPAEVKEVGRSFHVPQDRRQEEAGEQAISNQKAFKTVFGFHPPKEFQERLIPGVKGQVVIH